MTTFISDPVTGWQAVPAISTSAVHTALAETSAPAASASASPQSWLMQPPKAVQHVQPLVRDEQFFVHPPAEYVRACGGSYTAACVLANLVFRYQTDERGKPRLKTLRRGSFWWVRAREHLAADCRMTVDQLRQALKTLSKLGFIEARRMRYFDGPIGIYRGKTVMHLRLLCAAGAAAVDAWPDPSQMRMIPGGDFSPLNQRGFFPDSITNLKKDNPNKKEGNIKNPAALQTVGPTLSPTAENQLLTSKTTSKPTPVTPATACAVVTPVTPADAGVTTSTPMPSSTACAVADENQPAIFEEGKNPSSAPPGASAAIAITCVSKHPPTKRKTSTSGPSEAVAASYTRAKARYVQSLREAWEVDFRGRQRPLNADEQRRVQCITVDRLTNAEASALQRIEFRLNQRRAEGPDKAYGRPYPAPAQLLDWLDYQRWSFLTHLAEGDDAHLNSLWLAKADRLWIAVAFWFECLRTPHLPPGKVCQRIKRGEFVAGKGFEIPPQPPKTHTVTVQTTTPATTSPVQPKLCTPPVNGLAEVVLAKYKVMQEAKAKRAAECTTNECS